MSRPRLVVVATSALLLVGCRPQPRYSVVLLLQDEAGTPLAGSWAEVDGQRIASDADGRVALDDLAQPVLALAGGAGRLLEPVPLGFEDDGTELPLVLLAAEGRRVLHFGGDVMLGRRYLEVEEGEPLLGASSVAEDARELVSDLASAFGAADLSVVNLETVVGERPLDQAYPGKRWLLSTPPEALSALDELGVDLVTLGNNHLYDWKDAGVQDTLEALAQAGLPGVGAGLDRESAEAPVQLDLDGLSVGVLSWTSVDGSWVNDQYPGDDASPPADLAAEDAWLWELRSWGWTSLEGSVEIPVASRRAGGAWQALSAVEDELSEDEQARLWTSASAVYPELQDWVARRGHGGAAGWDEARAAAAIADLRDQVDLLIVQLHMGYQFSEAPAQAARDAAELAADAGADLVIMHHPHVLQGVEWLGEALVVYSLGNFVFDQDFLSTFPSGFLRVVVDEQARIVQARFVPTWLDAYRPSPVTGLLGDQVLHLLWERSVQQRTTHRGGDGAVRALPDSDAPGRAVQAVLEHHTLRLLDGVADPDQEAFELVEGEVTRVPAGLLVATPAVGVEGLELGRGLLGVGDFEDVDTDPDPFELMGWVSLSDDAHWTDVLSSTGSRALELVSRPSRGRTTARMVARAFMPEHRVYADEDGLTPLDGEASYTVRLRAWLRGQSDVGLVRVALYHFDDLDPTDDPVSTLIDEVELPFSVEGDGWQSVELELPGERLRDDGGLRANMALVYLSASEPDSRTTVLRVDEVELVEWRSAAAAAAGWQRADYLRGTGGRLELTVLRAEAR